MPLHEVYDVKTVKEAIINEFGTSSAMLEVARCESQYRQYNNDDSVLRGKIDNRDTGIFQINEKYHLDKSLQLGYSIYTVEGNIKMARYLYDKYGTQPWLASKSCWK